MPVHIERLAVTGAQITEWRLPTRPAKQTDPEAKKHGEVAVELDAIPPEKLTRLVTDAIVSHIDPHQWEIERAIEAEERDGLLRLAAA